MRRLFAIFSGSSSNASASVPAPQGEWNVLVDKDCHRITHRPAQAGDMYARQPVSVDYGGTVPGFKPDRNKSNNENIRGGLDYQIRAARNKELFEQAIFLLSQTEDGRRLLYKSKQEEFTFVFDPERTQRENAAGLCDYKNKLIPLSEGRTPEQVALTIKHEMQHMEDIKNGAGQYGPQDTLASATIANRGLEANARVSEAVFAMETMLGDPKGPDSQFKSYAIMAHFQQKKPHMGQAALNNRKMLEGKNGPDWKSFGNAVFPAYYDSTDTLAYYDERLAKMYAGGDLRTPDELRSAAAADPHYARDPNRIETYIGSIAKKITGILQNDRVTAADDLAATLTTRGTAYLKFGKNFNPASDSARGLTTRGLEAFEKLRTIIAETSTALANPQALESIPAHKKTRPPKGLSGKFASAVAAQTDTAPFEPIIMPRRTDGIMGTDGTRSNERTAQIFAKLYNEQKSSNEPIDKIEFAISDWMHNHSTGNIRGSMAGLLDAGLRAPVHAFPASYLHDLARRMQQCGNHPVMASNTPSLQFSPAELQLIEHWQTMAENGLSPLWIDKSHRERSIISDDREKDDYADIILSTALPKNQHNTFMQKDGDRETFTARQ